MTPEDRFAMRIGQATAQTLFEITCPNPTLAERARFAMSDPTPRRRCPGCLFITIRVTDDWCRECATRGGVREEVRSPRRSHAGGRRGPDVDQGRPA